MVTHVCEVAPKPGPSPKSMQAPGSSLIQDGRPSLRPQGPGASGQVRHIGGVCSGRTAGHLHRELLGEMVLQQELESRRLGMSGGVLGISQ